MEAKDTVMSEDELGNYWRNPEDCDDVGIAEDQAEISFKVGIREVVEWEQLYPYETHRSPSGLLCRVIRIPLTEWQAKLKEWGVSK